MSEGNNMLLSRLECNILRGLAILLIVINNFGHLVIGVHSDNEYNYDYANVMGFVDSISHMNYLFPLELLSFYSPFGVMLFIFLSGYGLTLKYEFGSGQSVSAKQFIFDHYSKLFSMQAKGLALFLVFLLMYNINEIVYFWPFIKQLFMIENLSPSLKIMPGPYWFFGMIMEVYIIYRFVFYKRSSWLMMSIVALSLFIMALLDPVGQMLCYLRINFCLALLPFSLGVLAARHWGSYSFLLESKLRVILLFIVSFLLLTLCKFNFYSWLFMPLFVVTTSVTLVILLSKVNFFSLLFGWFGSLSGVMFVVHPSLRQILIARANESGHCYAVVFIYLFLTIVLSVMLKSVFIKK